MTCIVGLVDQGLVVLGGDSGGVDTSSLARHVRLDRKVFARVSGGERWLFGFTTSFRMGQLLHHALRLPDLPGSPGKLEAFMVTTFVDAVRQCLLDGGWARKQNEQESGGDFLVAVHGRLFTITHTYQVIETADRFDAVGSGGEVALGSLASTVGRPARSRVRIALRAAAHLNAGVYPPFRLVTSGA